MVRLVAAFLLAAQIASAQVYVRTNDVLNLDPLSEVMQAQIGQQFRLRYVVTQGGVVQNITGYRITFEMIDVRDSIVSQTGTVQILDAPAGDVSVRFNVSGPTLQIGQTYQGVSKAYIGSNYVGLLSDDYISIVEAYCPTCSVSGGGGGGSTSVTVTNLNTSSVIVTNLIVSTNIISVTVTNTGGGGGSGTLSGFNSATTGGVFLVVSNGWDASITNEGNVFTINTGLPKGATGVNQVATWNGTNWIATALGAPTPTPSVGTNIIRWTTVWGVTNTFVAPSTQIMFTAWGAGGGNGSSGAGHARALWVGSAGTIFEIVVGTAGSNAATNNGPFSGAGISSTAVTNFNNGGGATYIAISGTTNIILIAGGSGGGVGATGIGGAGGGFWFSTLDGVIQGTNVLAGQGASASNEYGLAAIGGSNAVASLTNQMHVGRYLYGGHASTNGCTAGQTPPLGGGGGGWYGGAGATRTNATVGSANGAGGGGGLGYADTNYVIFAQLYAGQKSAGGSPAGQDHPTYTSGRGVGGANAAAGVNGCAGAMW